MFSVVIPLYNKGQTVVNTVQSVLSQDFEDFEIVIVDDGSTDDGAAKIESSFVDPRIRIIRQENAGEGAARNTAINAARYNWIATLDADDWWLPGYLSQLNDALRLFPRAGVFSSGGVNMYPDGSGYVRQSRRYGKLPQKVDFFKEPYFFAIPSSVAFSKELALATGGFPVSMMHQADVVFFYRLALLTEVVFCPAPFSVYSLGLAGQVSADRRTNIAGTVESSNQIYGFWDSLDPIHRDPRCITALVNNVRGALRYALMNSDYDLVNYFFTNIDPRLFRRLTAVERFLYPRTRLRHLALGLNRALEVVRRIDCPPPKFTDDVTNIINDARRQSTRAPETPS